MKAATFFSFSFVLLLALTCAASPPPFQGELLYGNKMYPNGTYARLRGVNVIAKILPSQTPWLEALHQYLESTTYIKRHYSILPLESFHMTVHPLFTEYEIPSRFKFNRTEWDDILEPLSGSMLNFIMRYLDKHPLMLHPSFDAIHPSTGILTVSLNLPQNEVDAVSLLWAALRKRYPDKESVFGIARDVFGLDPAAGTYGFHFTIGYFYNHGEIRANIEGLTKELEELDAFFSKNFVGQITLDAARLHWFNSMTDFQPVTWKDTKKSSLVLFGREIGVKQVWGSDHWGSVYITLFFVVVLLCVGVLFYVINAKKGILCGKKDASYLI